MTCEIGSDLKLYMAPMEGVVDWVVRDQLTRFGGIDRCVTEFIRVTDRMHSDRIFFEYCPELKTGSRTLSGVPIYLQFLGGHAEPLALNAQRGCELGALGIDLNFGCPAKLVNRHDGGAALLKSPERIFNIVKAVRAAVPAHLPVTAKMRLGIDSPDNCLEVAHAVAEAGATALTVHARTKADFYKPPAYWQWITKIRESVKISIVANGDIFTVEDLVRCQAETGCSEFMIGRGALMDPFLFSKIRVHFSQGSLARTSWSHLKEILPGFFDECVKFENKNYAVARTKQWLFQMAKRNTEAHEFFQTIKAIVNPEDFKSYLAPFKARSACPLRLRDLSEV